MKHFFDLSRFTRTQTIGLVFLLLIVLSLQLFLFFRPKDKPDAIALQDWTEARMLLAKLPEKKENKWTPHPFNPNFISDYKGYLLGMSVEQIDRLHKFRDEGKFVNSKEDFRKVTGVHDSVLRKIAPYFKFPDWVRKKQQSGFARFPEKKIVKTDINLADAAALDAVYGIGEVLSKRILEQREKLGAFTDFEQLRLVWGLSAEVQLKVQERFFIGQAAGIRKVNVNEAGVKELAAFPYFGWKVAKKVIALRTMSGKITNPDELSKIEELNSYNIKIIALYLEF